MFNFEFQNGNCVVYREVDQIALNLIKTFVIQS